MLAQRETQCPASPRLSQAVTGHRKLSITKASARLCRTARTSSFNLVKQPTASSKILSRIKGLWRRAVNTERSDVRFLEETAVLCSSRWR